jgi:6-pyruvoyl-tetrahydropterin synthase
MEAIFAMTSEQEEYDTCPICAQTRRKVTWICCPKCSFSSCRGCVKRFLLDLPDINPVCMSCKTQWDFEFLAENTDEEFHNQVYRNYRAKILVDRERSLLPATQPYVASVKIREDLKKELHETTQEVRMYQELLSQASKKKSELREKLREAEENGDEKKIQKKNIRFIGNCPQSECKGFLDTEYVCGLCKGKACRSCRLPKHEGQCDKNVVETVRLLAKDTRSCPNCGVPIFRISGCSQMFCTRCHTPFDWETGKIETGRIHNPHYYEFQRQNGVQRREPGDVRCGGQVDYYALHDRLTRNYFEQKIIDWVLNAHRLSGHIRAVVLPQYREDEVGEETNRDLRIKYLLGSINDKEWISQIKKREKKREKNRAITLSLTMFVDTMDDLQANILVGDPNDIPNYLVQMKNLRQYTRDVLNKISARFQNKVPSITKDWRLKDCARRVINMEL